MEKPVTFLNQNDKNLFGVVHIPEQKLPRGKRMGINLLNPGIKYRVAPHRLNVKLARRLCNQGYYVLRFDPEGIGDSQGELSENLLTADIWEQIQKGLFISDVKMSNNFFVENYGIEHLLLIGNCGGAITALLASEKDNRIKGLVLIDVPVNLRSSQQTFADKVVPGGQKAELLFSEYTKKLFTVDSWYRFFTLESNYKAIYKTLMMKFLKIAFPKNFSKTKPDLNMLCEKFNLNKFFYQAFKTFYQRKNPILFVLAGNDRGTEFFNNYFQSIILNNGNKENVSIHTINDANHVYTFYEWQEELIDNILTWITSLTNK